MQGQAAVAAAATLVALAFALRTLERWLDGRRRHEAAWTIALFLFAAGSAALWAGAGLGWREWDFRAFYLFGAILNVPFLALGTVYLLARRRVADASAVVVGLLGAFAAGVIVMAPMAPFPSDELPRGAEVFGVLPRVLAAAASGVGASVLIAGAVWSAVRLVRGRRSATPSVSPVRLAIANLLIALGTIVLSLGGLLNSVVGEMNAFSISLVVGITIIFAGFLVTEPAPAPPAAADPRWLIDLLDDEHQEPSEGSSDYRALAGPSQN